MTGSLVFDTCDSWNVTIIVDDLQNSQAHTYGNGWIRFSSDVIPYADKGIYAHTDRLVVLVDRPDK